jgi:hypothetical protein
VSASDLAAVIVATASVVAVVLLAVGVVALLRTLRALREVAHLLRTETVPVLDDLRSTVDAANGEIERLDRLVTMANPVIKGVAFASGTAKAARRLRGRRGDNGASDPGATRGDR